MTYKYLELLKFKNWSLIIRNHNHHLIKLPYDKFFININYSGFREIGFKIWKSYYFLLVKIFKTTNQNNWTKQSIYHYNVTRGFS